MRRLTPLLLVLAGCVSSGTGGDDDDSNGATAPDTRVYDNCVDYAERRCAQAQACCQQAYGAFEHEGCVTWFKRDVCHPAADAVAAGRATFDESAVEDCLAAHAEELEICTPTWAQTLELRKRVYAACRIVDGKSELGSGCSVAATCKTPEGNATVVCNQSVCEKIEILGEGAECPFPSGAVSVCDEGLTCDAPGLGAAGHCVKAPALGDACDPGLLESTACGLGSYCDADSATCKLTVNLGGPGCSQSTECVSFDCDRGRNSCAAAYPVVQRVTCVGPAEAP
jgi:hypothetical protein